MVMLEKLDNGVIDDVMDMVQQVLGGWDGEVLLESVEGLSEKVEGLGGNSKGWTNEAAYVLTQPRYRFLIFQSENRTVSIYG